MKTISYACALLSAICLSLATYFALAGDFHNGIVAAINAITFFINYTTFKTLARV